MPDLKISIITAKIIDSIIKLCYNKLKNNIREKNMKFIMEWNKNSNYYEGKIDNKLYYPYVNGSVMLKQLE